MPKGWPPIRRRTWAITRASAPRTEAIEQARHLGRATRVRTAFQRLSRPWLVSQRGDDPSRLEGQGAVADLRRRPPGGGGLGEWTTCGSAPLVLHPISPRPFPAR